MTITPNSRWGGEGMVGCGIGYGYLHRIPVRGNIVHIPPTTTIFNQTPTISPNTNQNTDVLTSQNVQQSVVVTSAVPDSQLSTSTVNSNTKETVPIYTSNVPAPSTIPNFNNLSFQAQSVGAEMPAFDMSKYADQNVTSPPQVSLHSLPAVVNPLMYNPADYPSHIPPTSPTYSYPIQDQSGATQVFSSPSTKTLPPPPLSGFQNQPIIFDPHIAAQSAQQLLSGNLTTTSKASQIM